METAKIKVEKIEREKERVRERERNKGRERETFLTFWCIYLILMKRSVVTAKVLLACPSLLGKRYIPIQDHKSMLRMF